MAPDTAPVPIRPLSSPATPLPRDVQHTTCCIVGGGPAGAVLGLLLARQGVPVLLLEAHADFDRDFRGDTLHPAILEIMDEIELADRLLLLPHTKMRNATVMTAAGPIQAVDFGRLHTRFPYIAMMPQSRFLNFIVSEAQRYANFHIVMRAHVQELIEEDGVVRGVCYQGQDGRHAVRAMLTVGADGRFSQLRKLAGFQPIVTSPPMDILWFRLPKRLDDPPGVMGRFGRGAGLIALDRGEQWQLGYVVPKGSYQSIKAAGIDTLRQAIVMLEPSLADRIGQLASWQDIAVLAVAADRLPRWYKPGLLLIGDAAHVMSPVGGNGINYAIQDAVAAANILTTRLQTGQVRPADLAAVQHRRAWPTRFIQAMVTMLQRRVIGAVLDPQRQEVPLLMRAAMHLRQIPVLRDVPAHILAFGIRREHVAPALRHAKQSETALP
jgi:2-polyprenyl-6-methoxyphenol hydroxylase-like FAD-dependent oxidoreductase